MSTVYWIFGGTAVGKKTFIQRALFWRLPWFTGSAKAVWFECGERTDADIIAECESVDAALVRWQWGREAVMEKMIETRHHNRHVIVLMECDPNDQVRRAEFREGSMKWNDVNLTGERDRVRELVDSLREKHNLPVIEVDSSEYEFEVRER